MDDTLTTAAVVGAQWEDTNDEQEFDDNVEEHRPLHESLLHQAVAAKSDHKLENAGRDLDTASIVAHVEGPGPSVRAPTTSLDKYVCKAEARCGLPQRSTAKIFNHAPNVEIPKLEKFRSNRILVYAGCFNPPHRGHLELLYHTYLRTDDKTIAAMILPMADDRCEGKAHTETFTFTKEQRAQLWYDEVLMRFAWVFPGTHRDVKKFMYSMKEFAKEDGFRLSFTALCGADHARLDGMLGRSWGTGSVITSDITRPSELMVAGYAKPCPVLGCEEWYEIWSARGVHPIEGVAASCPCWACWKLSRVCPELWSKGTKSHVECFGSDARTILHRCHQAGSSIWMASREGGGILWFLPSGRQYPIDNTRTQISSTAVRQTLAMYSAPRFKLYRDLASLVPHPGRLIRIVQDNGCWLKG